MLRVTFLGTAASRPTVQRNVSAIAVQREGELMLFDCGEGTQRQMMRHGTGFTVGSIFFTHMHADHFLGVVGLLRTMGLQGRSEPVDLYGPPSCRSILAEAVNLGIERVPFEVRIHELEPGQKVEREVYDVLAYPVRHGTSAVGYALTEHVRLGRFNPERAQALGVPEGPLFRLLHHGEAVVVDGREIRPEEVVGPPRAGRCVVYTGDTLPCESTVEIARGADLLIHEATFGEDEAERAHETWHSTARDAADIARRAGVRRLALMHLSARYADSPRILEREARAIFRDTVVPDDGHVIEVPYRHDTD